MDGLKVARIVEALRPIGSVIALTLCGTPGSTIPLDIAESEIVLMG